MAETENLDALREFRQRLEALKTEYPALTTPEAQERLRQELERQAAEQDDRE
jgi:hypothetical protein